MATLPPIPGTPWLLRSLQLPERKAAPTTAPPSAIPYRAPPPTFGPPVPGAPWFTRALTFPKARPTPTGPTPGPLPVPAGRLSPVLPFLPRVPDIESPSGKDQLRRFTEILSSAFNSLVGQRQLIQTGQATWSLAPAMSAGPGVGVYGDLTHFCILTLDAEGRVTAVSLAPAPVVNPGIMAPYAGDDTPSGWLVCDGLSYPVASYPGLFAAIGYLYGGSGENFNVPNLIGHSP